MSLTYDGSFLCATMFTFNSPNILEQSRLIENAAMGYNSGSHTIIALGSSLHSPAPSTVTQNYYTLRTSATGTGYHLPDGSFDTNYWYAGTNIAVDEPSGQVVADTARPYDESVYLQYCCEQPGVLLGGGDCRTTE